MCVTEGINQGLPADSVKFISKHRMKSIIGLSETEVTNHRPARRRHLGLFAGSHPYRSLISEQNTHDHIVLQRL